MYKKWVQDKHKNIYGGSKRVSCFTFFIYADLLVGRSQS